MNATCTIQRDLWEVPQPDIQQESSLLHRQLWTCSRASSVMMDSGACATWMLFSFSHYVDIAGCRRRRVFHHDIHLRMRQGSSGNAILHFRRAWGASQPFWSAQTVSDCLKVPVPVPVSRPLSPATLQRSREEARKGERWRAQMAQQGRGYATEPALAARLAARGESGGFRGWPGDVRRV